MRNFIEAHFDKLLLAAIFCLMVCVVLVLSASGKSAETVSWAREVASGLEGGLLGLITGVAVGRKMGPPDPPAGPVQ